MTRRPFAIVAALLAACLFARSASADDVDRTYAVVVSDATYSDPAWRKVVDALTAKHPAATVVRYGGDVTSAVADLRRAGPRYVAFVAKPTEVGRSFVVAVSRLTRHLATDGTGYGDALWGIVTGPTPADTVRMASVREPLVIRSGGAGTNLDLSAFDAGEWFSEGTAGEYWTKAAGSPPVRHADGPADSTKAIVDYLNDGHPDLFVTSGHASERVWALGYKYKNGHFASGGGQMFGVDLIKQRYPVHSPNPKVFLAIGNCLMGHIDSPDCMALGWIGSGGVDQFVGYTVVTWYGKMGWGVNSYLFNAPGRYDLAEAFYFSNQCVLHELAERFSATAKLDLPLPESDGNNPEKTIDDFAAALHAKVAAPADGKAAEDQLGLMWDRDTVAFYGDPLWDARLLARGPAVHTAVTHDGTAYTLTISADAAVKLDKPLALLLPHRLVGVRDVKVVDGGDLRPLVTGNFAMLFNLPTVEPGRRYTVTFTADERPTAVASR
jgi:hypothetical protein